MSEQSDDDYMRGPRAKTVEGFIAGLTILAKHMEEGMQTSYFCGGKHDVIHLYVDLEKVPEGSDDGRDLHRLGFHAEDGGWAYFT